MSRASATSTRRVHPDPRLREPGSPATPRIARAVCDNARGTNAPDVIRSLRDAPHRAPPRKQHPYRHQHRQVASPPLNEVARIALLNGAPHRRARIGDSVPPASPEVDARGPPLRRTANARRRLLVLRSGEFRMIRATRGTSQLAQRPTNPLTTSAARTRDGPRAPRLIKTRGASDRGVDGLD